jgi:O-antigen/teichoic acid export membrane protein
VLSGRARRQRADHGASAHEALPDAATGETPPENSLLANTGWLIGSRLAIGVLGWAGTVMIARTLSLEEFGRFTIIFTILGLMSIVTDMGIGRIALRGLLGRPGDDPSIFAGAYLSLRTIMGVFGYGLALLIVVLLGYPAEVVQATAVAAIVIVLATPSSALDVVFQSRMRMGTVSVSNVVGQVGQVALTAAIASAGGSVLYFVLPAVACEIIVLACKIPAARRIMPLRFRISLSTWRALLVESIPLTLGIGLATLYYRVDSIMLSRLDTFDAVGIYGVSYKFIDIVHFAASAVTVPLLTLLVRAWPDDTQAFRDALRRGAMLLGILGGLAVVGLVGFPAQLTTLLYGEEYAAGADATRILVVAQFLTLFASLGLTTLIAMGRHRIYPLVMLAGLLINVSANAVVIPRYSYEGAAFATLGAEVVVSGALVLLVRREASLRPLDLGRLLVVLPAIGFGLGAGWAADLVMHWILAGLVATLAFLAVAVLGGLVRAAGVELPRRRTGVGA